MAFMKPETDEELMKMMIDNAITTDKLNVASMTDDRDKRIAELEGQIQNCFSIVWGADSIDEARHRVAALLGKFEPLPRPPNPNEPE